MPEQITKYPDVTIRVLKGAGARCGEGVEQTILTACPPERFCSMPTGEICVYGLADIPKMTQVKPADLRKIVCPPENSSAAQSSPPSAYQAAALGAALVVGVVIGGLWGKRQS